MMIGGSYADRDWYKTLTKTPTTIGYILMNALDPEVGGEMVTRFLQEGEVPWVDWIKDNFLHPSPESLNTFIATPKPEVGKSPATAKPEVGKSPTREGAILFSSKESTGSSNGLIHRSTCAGPRVRPVRASRGYVASKLSTAELKAAAVRSEQEEPEKKTAAEVQTRKHFSPPKSLDYVVVSDTLSGLDLGMKRAATKTKMIKPQ
ncbi:hypothetical protein Hanom_Chr02g00123631 [Helianthus anomalus]